MASRSLVFAQLALAAVAAVLLCGRAAATPAESSLRLWNMQVAINSTKSYSAFQPYFYSSIAPLAIFNKLEMGKKVTIFVPSNKVMAAIPASVKSSNTTFGEMVLFNSMFGVATIRDLKGAKVGKTFTSLRGQKWRKVTAANRWGYALRMPGSTEPTRDMQVVVGNMFRDKSIYCHGVNHYFYPVSS